ncbi:MULTISPECIES: transcription elongation factor GreA [unclassified Aureimonas]|uniref:transcription elongation factor GreA n=1 Tax=unclassified Aureimonas TaxID=2615206 RepID=UPI0006FB72E2|nr:MULTISPECIES: transcription elongation factor GreA [unclassified Aureimonas]KQT66157.1 transcription elongation factor [Aureimonas sp. Leaf427]KQT73402.1 transcription elongation factor [Aureimonas sp. Leaf460]
MSVAFVKEPNDSQVETLPDRDLGTDQNLVTQRGLGQLDAELERLNAAIEAARVADDKIALATLNRDLRYIHARRATAELMEAPSDSDKVHFGSRVTIERDDGRRQSFSIVGIDEADPAEGRVSYLAPLARSLLGRAVGDTVKAGANEAEIVEIEIGT